MAFDSNGESNFSATSPGGFFFGVVGWVWGPPVPRSMTFFLDNTVVICDQYGRYIRAAVGEDGREVKFADRAPDTDIEGSIFPRPQFATHAQVIEALRAEKIDWLAYEVVYADRNGARRSKGGMSLAEAQKFQAKLIAEKYNPVLLGRSIVTAGWPQLPYEELKKLPEVPKTPLVELSKILDRKLRADAMRYRKEVDEMRANELQVAGVED